MSWFGFGILCADLGLLLVLISGLLGLMIVGGLLQPRRWSLEIWLEGLRPGTQSDFKTPPLRPATDVIAFRENGTDDGAHLYILGSDGGGRDMLGLLAARPGPSLSRRVADGVRLLLLIALLLLAFAAQAGWRRARMA